MTKSTSRIVAAVAVVIAGGALCGAFYQMKNNASNSSTPSKVATAEPSTIAVSTPIDSTALASLKKRYPAISREEAMALARAEAGKADPMDNKEGAVGPSPTLTIDKTKRPDAEALARRNAGRRDPMQPVAESSWGRRPQNPTVAQNSGEPSHGPVQIPPPPEVTNHGHGTGSSIVTPVHNIDKKPQFLPAPLHLKLSAIVGDRAIVLVPKELQIQNGWPRSFCLAKGDSIEDVKERKIHVAAIGADSLVLEENGERFAKSLAEIH